MGKIEKILDANVGLRLATVPGTVTFIDRLPATFTKESHTQLPDVLFVQLHDDGLPLPNSNDPFGAVFDAVAGNSRYIKPDPIPNEAYSNPPD
ncbi:MAG: hypothetical protein ACRD3M_07405 [Thermoanaerobaculia bacterium]